MIFRVSYYCAIQKVQYDDRGLVRGSVAGRVHSVVMLWMLKVA